jgi:hypothetical protein
MNKLRLVVNVGGIPKALRQVAVTGGCLIDRAFSHLIYQSTNYNGSSTIQEYFCQSFLNIDDVP